MTILRRRFLLKAGEELLLSHSALAVAERFDRMAAASGLDPEDIFSDPLCATPLPIYRKDDGGGVRRFAAANPEFLWHPVMWLPRDTALRFQVREPGEGTEPRIETDHEWAIRVSLLLAAWGLYRSDDGGWLDVLALHGLDIANPVDYARVVAWQAGGADPILDGIDLAELADDGDDQEWAFRAAQDLVGVLAPAQWQLSATSLLAFLDDDDSPGVATVASELAWEMLADADAGIEARLIGIHGQVAAGDPDGTARLRELLAEVAAEYQWAVDDLDDAATGQPRT